MTKLLKAIRTPENSAYMLNLTVYYIIGKIYNTIGNPALLHYRLRCYNTIGNPHYYINGKYYNIIGKLLHYW